MSTNGAETPARNPEASGPVSSLIPAVARAHRAIAASLLRDLNLAPGQELLLMMLWEREPRHQAEITRELAVEPPTSAKMLARMERAGVITRERCEDDRRVVLVSLTEKGRGLREPVRAVWSALEERTTAGLSAEDQEQLTRLLNVVLANVTAHRD
ncbi:MarR family winged helix-turn-helix transcriptional regulator [Arthrobacter castelli]|uniref:MarR family winged helix-turn-helix transcriptional regulator n=1 Tax=Arthrobacter castelli TaxID=271431 RepID=UPI0003FF1973|nr:MarR family transcriptional regulator [Arthrobacter castelli]